jgi:serine/threonine-protein phosphatase 6 regulatory ankyrin repeat subunit A
MKLLILLGCKFMKIFSKCNTWLLQSAEDQDHKRFASLLHFWGVDINSQNQSGETSLHIAAKNKNKKMVEGLLSYPDIIDVNATDNNNSTPLHIVAADRNDTEIFPLIINHPAIDMEAPDNQERTPLHVASESGNIVLARSLIAKGVNINLLDKNRNAPLHTALKNNKEEIAKLLLDQPDIDVNLRGNDLNTPLHIAIRESCSAINWLLKKRADVNLCNKDGDTPLHIAVKGDYLEVIQQLAKENADLNLGNEEGNRALDIALRGKNQAVAKFLLDQPGIKASPEDWDNYVQLQREAFKSVQDKITESSLKKGSTKYPKAVKFKSTTELIQIKPAITKKLYPELRDSINEYINEDGLNPSSSQDDFGIKLLGGSDAFSAPL